ncbi:hypothetical protein [uncultured Chryseobacterium sp.]|uniref:hypothetical protein n=1 Tax=uncultured Chryseobacterium sp. TaxID=259322 RepID=UPI00258E49C6|nr:hypothetical protein [uncultured Chryseobacterium sp.]
MKKIKIEGEYIVKSDLIKMLEEFVKELKKPGETVLFEVKSNYGGDFKACIKTDDLPDLRQKIEQP